jgi:hypothetical protein
MRIGKLKAPALVSLFVILSAAVIAPAQVRIFDTHGSADTTEWTTLPDTAEWSGPDAKDMAMRTVIDNGTIRIAYPCNYAYSGNGDQKGGFLFYVKLNGQWTLAQDRNYGDWFYVVAGIETEPTAFRILENEAQECKVQMEFGNHANTWANPNVPFTTNKTIIVRPGEYGYTIRVWLSNSSISGEKESGFGPTTQHNFFYSEKIGYMRPYNSSGGAYYKYVRDDEETGSYWGCALPSGNTFYRLICVNSEHPAAIRLAQWGNPTQAYGYFYQWLLRPCPEYRCYIAAVPYDGSQSRDITVSGGNASVNVPADGVYAIYSQTGDDQYSPAMNECALSAGSNSVPLNGVSLNSPIIVPISNGTDFPDDLWNAYINPGSQTSIALKGKGRPIRPGSFSKSTGPFPLKRYDVQGRPLHSVLSEGCFIEFGTATKIVSRISHCR